MSTEQLIALTAAEMEETLIEEAEKGDEGIFAGKALNKETIKTAEAPRNTSTS